MKKLPEKKTNRPPSVHQKGYQRKPAVTDAVHQLPRTRGNTGGLNRAINPDNQPLAPPPGYGAAPSVTPRDSKIGYRGQEVASYDGKKR